MADKLEMENKVRRGELVDGKEIGEMFFTMATEVRQRLMMIPARVANQVAHAKRKSNAKKIIEKEIRDALESLSSDRTGIAARL